MTVYDRSWYGRLLVERVEGLITRRTCKLGAAEIVDFEDMLVNDGVTIVKFWLQISDEEQLRRFNDRASDPLKQWKLTDDDWRNREKRPAYLEAVERHARRHRPRHAHWDLIAAEDKHFARVAVLETLIDRWVHDLERRGLRRSRRPRAATTCTERRRGRPVSGTLTAMDSRYGITIPFDGVTLARAQGLVPPPRRPRLHRRVVRRGRRRRRLHAADPRRGVGAAPQPRRRRDARLHPRAGPAGHERRRARRGRRRAVSRWAWARRASRSSSAGTASPTTSPTRAPATCCAS